MSDIKKRNKVTIDELVISDETKPVVCAELGVNHLGDFERAKEMIFKAHKAGSDILKFQTYISELRYDRKNNKYADEFIKLLSDWEFKREIETELWNYARELGATVYTTPFDIKSLEFAESLNCPAYKIAAYEINNYELINQIVKCKKPIVISRGMCTLEELDKVVELFEKNSCPYVILHTISSYPVLRENSNLRMIHTLRDRYSCPIGHSDHTRGTVLPPLAVAAGASFIEKHFTVNPKLRLSDNPFSVCPDEMEDLVYNVKKAFKYMGSGEINKIDTEDYMFNFRRSS